MVEHTSDELEVPGSNRAGAALELWQFGLPHFASIFKAKI